MKCVPGYDGGLPQKFILEVYHGDADIIVDKRLMYNISSMDEPIFALSDLETPVNSGVHVVIYAINAKGKSNPVVLSEVTFRDAEKHTGVYTVDVTLTTISNCITNRLISSLFSRARNERRLIPLNWDHSRGSHHVNINCFNNYYKSSKG